MRIMTADAVVADEPLDVAKARRFGADALISLSCGSTTIEMSADEARDLMDWLDHELFVDPINESLSES